MRNVWWLVVLGATAASAAPPRLELGVETGYARELGPRSSDLPPNAEGAQFGVDAQFRFVDSFSAGVYGRALGIRTLVPALGSLEDNRGALLRIGVLIDVALPLERFELHATWGAGYQSGINLRRGATGQVTVAVLVKLDRMFKIGAYVEALGSKDLEGARRDPDGRTLQALTPLFYGWVSFGLRGTLNVL